MTTQINVIVDNGGLSAKAKQQTQVNRWQKLEQDNRQKVEQQGLQQRDAERLLRGIGPDGRPLYGTPPAQPQRRDEPAAFRQQKKGIFGYMPAGYSDYGGYDAYTEEAYIGPDTPITPKKYGAVKLGLVETCNSGQGATIESSYFNSRTQELVSYVKGGGVLWIQNEWQSTSGTSGCGINAQIINAYIADAFDCTIGFGLNNYYGYNLVTIPAYGAEADSNSLVYAKAGFKAPPFFYTDLVSPVINGTAMYSHPSAGVVVGFEKIGKGYLVLSADSNATAAFPIGVFEGQEYTFIDALLTLR